MNICFYTYSSDHLFIDVLVKSNQYKSVFSNSNHFFIADNRVHIDAYKARGYNILYLSDINSDDFIDYPPSDNRLISMKRYTLIDRPAYYQENVFDCFSKRIRYYFKKNKIDLVIFPQQIQSMEGTLILSIAKENGIKVASPHGTRLKHIAYFNDSEQSFLPIFKNKIQGINYEKAQNLRNHFLRENSLPYPFSQKHKFERKNIFIRFINRIKRTTRYGEEFELPDFIFSLFINVPFILGIVRRWNKRKLKNFFDLNSENELPKKFIYFPLQVYPEASIHIPSPFFKDQERVIDLIRLSLPKDYKLIVKEHPLMEGRRSIDFYKTLNKKSGVRLINTKVNSNQIIRKSALTISVSGTAVLEAYLLKKPSFTFGITSFSGFTNSIKVDLNNIKNTIIDYIEKDIADEDVLKNLALLYQNSFNFNNYSIEYDPEFARSQKNLSNFMEALVFYLNNQYGISKK